MKKLSILLLLPLFFACSSDKKDEVEPTQDYTSFIFQQTVDKSLPNCVVAYLDKDSHFVKVASLGTVSLNKPSTEIRIEDGSITELYFFTDYAADIEREEANRFDAIYKLKINNKNIFLLDKNTKGIIVNRTDSKQYPQ